MERLTIDETIQKENNIAEENQKIVDTEIVFDDVSLSQLYCDDTEVIEEHLENYKKCAEYHKQIADWLEELKAYKERKCNKSVYLANKSIDMIDAVNKGYAEGYNKAIDDFAKWLESKKYLMKEIHEHYLCYTHYDEMQANDVIREYLAEQLKAGESE